MDEYLGLSHMHGGDHPMRVRRRPLAFWCVDHIYGARVNELLHKSNHSEFMASEALPNSGSFNVHEQLLERSLERGESRQSHRDGPCSCTHSPAVAFANTRLPLYWEFAQRIAVPSVGMPIRPV